MNSFIKNHLSFIVLIFGGGGLYLANFILYFYLSSEEYARYGLLSAYISIITVFTGFGFDQVIIKNSKLDNDAIFIPAEMVLPSIFLVLGSGFIFSFLFSFYFWGGDLVILYICAVASGLSLYYYTMFRLSSRFVSAQFQKNLWKFLFPLGVLFFFYKLEANAELILILMVTLIVLTSFLGWIEYKKLKVEYFSHGKFDWHLLWGYFSAMAIMNFMTSSDRFFIDAYLGKEELARFFFFQNVFLFPLIQLQTYFGFKDVVEFKRCLNYSLLKVKLKNNVKISFFVAAALFLIFFIADLMVPVSYQINLSNDWSCILILMLTGILRVWYASLSAAMSVHAESKTINYLNFLSLISILAGSLLFMSIEINSILVVVLVFLVFWLQRAVSYYFVLWRALREV